MSWKSNAKKQAELENAKSQKIDTESIESKNQKRAIALFNSTIYLTKIKIERILDKAKKEGLFVGDFFINRREISKDRHDTNNTWEINDYISSMVIEWVIIKPEINCEMVVSLGVNVDFYRTYNGSFKSYKYSPDIKAKDVEKNIKLWLVNIYKK